MTAHGWRVSFSGDESYLELVVMVAQLYVPKTTELQFLQFIRVNFMACPLDLKGKINSQVENGDLFTHLLNKYE